MLWFGSRPFSAACEGAPRCETPVGAPCAWCEEPIAAGDPGYMMPHINGTAELSMQTFHVECFIRSVTGGLNHLRGACTCCGGTEPPDPPHMTRRQAAVAACVYWGLDIESRYAVSMPKPPKPAHTGMDRHDALKLARELGCKVFALRGGGETIVEYAGSPRIRFNHRKHGVPPGLTTLLKRLQAGEAPRPVLNPGRP